jgi:hypothetical protein
MKAFAISLVALLIGSPVLAQTSGVEKARLARNMWSAFQCSMLAEMTGDQNEQQRLFMVGIKSGRDFLDALKNGQISRDNVEKEVPWGVTMYLAGPSTDFIIGRIFQEATRDTYDEMDAAKTMDDPELRRSKAKTGYLKNKCVLIK